MFDEACKRLGVSGVNKGLHISKLNMNDRIYLWFAYRVYKFGCKVDGLVIGRAAVTSGYEANGYG